MYVLERPNACFPHPLHYPHLPLTNCEFTRDRGRIGDVDAVMRTQDYWRGDPSLPLARDSASLIWLGSGSAAHSSLRLVRDRELLSSYRRCSDAFTPYQIGLGLQGQG